MTGVWTAGRKSVFILAGCILFFWTVPDAAIGAAAPVDPMKRPHKNRLRISPTRQPSVSSVQITFLEFIGFYQQWISPIGGDRCGFRPSCSRYAHSAFVSQGPLVGLMMTADRLIRCNIWKKPGPDYYLLPIGRLYDPLTNNMFSDP